MSTGATPEEIRADIESTREELGDTIEALAHKTDVKARASDKVEETKAAAAGKAEELRGRAQDVLGQAKEATPDQVLAGATQASQRAAETARRNPIPVAAIGAFVLGFLLGRITASGDDEE